MAFYHKTRVEGQIIQMLDEAQVDPSSVGMDDVASPRPTSGPFLTKPDARGRCRRDPLRNS